MTYLVSRDLLSEGERVTFSGKNRRERGRDITYLVGLDVLHEMERMIGSDEERNTEVEKAYLVGLVHLSEIGPSVLDKGRRGECT